MNLIGNDIVSSYRNYYNSSKQNIMKWTKRDTLDWFSAFWAFCSASTWLIWRVYYNNERK